MLISLAVASLLLTPPSEVKPPDVIYFAPGYSQAPVWVSVDEAFDADGNLKPSLVPLNTLRYGRLVDYEERRYGSEDRSFRIVEDDQCPSVLGVPLHHGRPAKTVEDLIEHSVAIYRARIVGLSYGFYAGEPGVLLRAIPLESWKDTEEISTEHDLLLFHNYARFAAGNIKFCAGFREPKIGEEILVFAYQTPIDELRSIIYVHDRIFFEASDGTIEILPTWTLRFDKTRFPSLKAFVSMVEETLSKSAGSNH